MAVNSIYCRAYKLRDLKKFEQWPASLEYARKEPKDAADDRAGEVSRPLEDEDVVYVHDTYRVTDGIFVDEDVLFDGSVPEWVEFCRSVLQFAPPAR